MSATTSRKRHLCSLFLHQLICFHGQLKSSSWEAFHLLQYRQFLCQISTHVILLILGQPSPVHKRLHTHVIMLTNDMLLTITPLTSFQGHHAMFASSTARAEGLT